jgi:RNA polymerase sigma factor (sigma-70 family)
MSKPSPADSVPQSALDQISTRWVHLQDPRQFLLRYGPAIQKYLQALLKNADDVEEVKQDILVRVVQDSFSRANPDRGRFRDYLKIAVRNTALSHLRRRRAVQVGDAALGQVPDPDASQPAAEQQWLAEWQRCALNKAWRALENHQRTSPGNLFHTVLKVAVEHPEEDSRELAERTAALIGRQLRADAFRKQLSRARRMFAQLLVEEVAQTLEEPKPALVEEN